MSPWGRIYRNGSVRRIRGISRPAFFVQSGFGETTYELTDIEIYKYGTVCYSDIANTEEDYAPISIDRLSELIDQGYIVASLPEGAKVRIGDIGFFTANYVIGWVEEREFVKELRDDVESLNGRPTSSDRCREEYQQFMDCPTEEGRMRLLVAYEAIPEHNRQYVLQDMDAKDIPVRMIIYGDHELENWTHRIVARATNSPQLPSITVPHVHEIVIGDEGSN